MRRGILTAAAFAVAISPNAVLGSALAYGDPNMDCSTPPTSLVSPGNNTEPINQSRLRIWRMMCGGYTTEPASAPTTGATPSAITTPVQNPKVPNGGIPRTSGPSAVVAPPKKLDASPSAVAAAKDALPTRVDPANPSKLPPDTFAQQVQNLINAHRGTVETVKAGNQELVRPRHWEYIDYDAYRRPNLYNPLNEKMTFHYFYGGDYREIYLPAGSRIALDVAVGGVFPFTAVGDNYVTAGSFNGGAWIPPDGWTGPPPDSYTPPQAPTEYHNVAAYLPADNQTVQVVSALVVGHDTGQPAGSQDVFLLDDSTLAWGQANDVTNGGQLTLTRTQSLPGVGPTDNGDFLAALATHPQPNRTWLWALGAALVVSVLIAVASWLRKRRAGVPVHAEVPTAVEGGNEELKTTPQ